MFTHQFVTNYFEEYLDPYGLFYVLLNGNKYYFQLPDVTYTIDREKLNAFFIRENKPNAISDFRLESIVFDLYKGETLLESFALEVSEIIISGRIPGLVRQEIDKITISINNRLQDTVKMNFNVE